MSLERVLITHPEQAVAFCDDSPALISEAAWGVAILNPSRTLPLKPRLGKTDIVAAYNVSEGCAMADWVPQETLQDSSGLLGTLLASWLIWPVLCGLLGARRGELGRGAWSGLLWGPIGLFMVLLAKRKYVCPTCGQKTLMSPHSRDSSPVAGQPHDVPSLEVEIPEPRFTPPSLVRPPVRPLVATEHREAAPLSKEDREKIVAAACAGYDAEEAARLRSWLNNE
jgi:hypothetical protein